MTKEIVKHLLPEDTEYVLSGGKYVRIERIDFDPHSVEWLRICEIQKRLQPYFKTLQDYVPYAEEDQRDIYDGMLAFLSAKTQEEMREICSNHRYFAKRIGVTFHKLKSGDVFISYKLDYEKFKALFNKMLESASYQKKMTKADLIEELRLYKKEMDKVLKQKETLQKEYEKFVDDSMNLQASILEKAASKTRITARDTKKAYENAIKLIHDSHSPSTLNRVKNELGLNK